MSDIVLPDDADPSEGTTIVQMQAENDQPFGPLEVKFDMSGFDMKDYKVVADWVEEEECLKDKDGTEKETSSSSEHSQFSSEDEIIEDDRPITERKSKFKKLISVREKAIMEVSNLLICCFIVLYMTE